MGKQYTVANKTWAEKWAILAKLCSQSTITLDRGDYQLISDLQDAIVACPMIEMIDAWYNLDANQREKFVFIAGVVLDCNTFITVMQNTNVREIVGQKNREIQQLMIKQAQLQKVCEQQADRISQLKEALEKISNDAFQALQ